mmetsp:Transcript_30925/g.75417  ORF Transcript_30925/g.75417 Transcript_30925/m.75417 type:complete len:305 (-) Transcript_30925:74-988(-)
MTEKKDAKITILVVSDPHDDVDGIKLIQNKLSREKVKIDAVFCPGDITTMPNKDYMLNPTKEEIENFTAKAKTIISALGEIPERGAERVFWIPGNHDPVTFFGPPSERQETAEWASGNIHGKVVELAPGLFLGGWGGCVEAFEDGKEVWKAYPYPESEVRRRLAKLEKELESTVEASRQNLILMTHSGPHLSSTAQVTGLDPNKIHLPGVRETIINSGSPSLTKLISKQSIQKSCVMAMHGHTHQGIGFARIGGVPILNPGSILHSDSFSILTLERKGAEAGSSRSWYLANLKMCFLDIDSRKR